MHVTALCPTFRHPTLLANSLACWNAQDYDPAKRRLIILDDDPTFETQSGENWHLLALPRRCRSISEKYNIMLAMLEETDIVLVWEDDDHYLSDYVSKHVAALQQCEYSKPSRVLSDYTGKLAEENADGRFHSSIGFRRSLIRRIGGWPNTKRADFDQQLMAALRREANCIADPWSTGRIPFVYRWHSGAAHCQSTMDRGPADESWWVRGEQAYAKVPFVGKLESAMDEQTKAVFRQLGYAL